MLSLTKKTDYAIIAMSHLALRRSALASARQIARSYGLPLSLLMNTLKQLSAAGLVRSVRGARGGYALARPARQITLADLVVAVEGPVRLTECVGPGEGPRGRASKAVTCCRVGEHCPIQGTLRGVQDRLQEFLSGITLAEIAGAGIGAGSAPVAEKR